MKDCTICSASLALSCGPRAEELPHKKRVGPRKMGAHHAVADGLEDFGQSEFGNQQAEGSAGGPVFCQHVRAGSGPPRDQAHALQVEDRLGHGDARSVEELAQFRLAGKPVARLQFTRLNAGKKMLEDAAVLGLLNSPDRSREVGQACLPIFGASSFACLSESERRMHSKNATRSSRHLSTECRYILECTGLE